MKLRSALWHEYAHAELSQRGLDTFLDEVEDRHTVGNLQVKGLRGRTYSTNLWEAGDKFLAYREQLRQRWGYIPRAALREYRFNRSQYERALGTVHPTLPGQLIKRFGSPLLPIP
jgi:hypothetical protein